ncbi:hypothetical protein DFA_00690 [Cavenderia fasciculata]|uniref:Uncharacterized protein n=1 Tax=Cavenderia fasciculata TaxID=261658 RepID=F4PT89_CACFS|nr:uncharacterized protein DFA_00690 [Cavenderia fasciculata]EGG20825.1 hypothetical protein DFA_00690 [Cavenderia fasciculata]|eukprot:XP_004358675.1 hypothetical protein DFA_00690 [Cavenderia fasciculata]
MNTIRSGCKKGGRVSIYLLYWSSLALLVLDWMDGCMSLSFCSLASPNIHIILYTNHQNPYSPNKHTNCLLLMSFQQQQQQHGNDRPINKDDHKEKMLIKSIFEEDKKGRSQTMIV